MHLFQCEIEQGVQDVMHALGTKTLCQGRGISDVAEEHRHLLALALERATVLEDAVRQMRRRIRAGIRWPALENACRRRRCGSRETSTAGPAELLPVGAFVVAASATHESVVMSIGQLDRCRAVRSVPVLCPDGDGSIPPRPSPPGRGRQVRILAREGSRIIAGNVASAIDAPCFWVLKVAHCDRGTSAPNGVAFRR
ncbi:MAG: hypothetical protein IPJ42_00485 [Betaproteobacteria bacterium]|nr:hypothetical protein [Betaproteobacteria bacterium]MBK7456918.1 hypothetical protein [Betaproteobacteria bacterium]MBL0297152.1 hypothetical protein [Betaproteobacteria bacterium]